jgi:hypothetical protein
MDCLRSAGPARRAAKFGLSGVSGRVSHDQAVETTRICRTDGSGTPQAKPVESSTLADLLLNRLAAMWLELTDAGQLAVVELAERLSVANRDGVKAGG